MLYILFDSSCLGNPTKYTGRVFGLGLNTEPAVDPADPIAVAAYVARCRASFRYQDEDDPTEHAERFHPTPEDDAFNAATSPLNHSADDLDAEATAAFFAHHALDPETWEEADAMGGAWGGHPDRIEV